jgi:hypothetical protein
MDEKMINGVLILFAWATAFYKGETPPSKIINCKNFTQSCHPSKERNAGQTLNLPNTSPGEGARLYGL